MEKYKCRCSAIADIMTNAKSKSEVLGQTAKTHLNNWYADKFFGKKKIVQSKYLTKGLLQEDSSLDIIAEVLGLGYLVKNEKMFENEYLRGTPDTVLNDFVIDVKSSWDHHTFPLLDSYPDKRYVYQLQGYMSLTGVKKAKLIHVLNDSPEHLIDSEARRYIYNFGGEDEDVYEMFRSNMTYGDVPAEKRVRVFEFDFCPETEKLINERVVECRKYLESCKKN